MKSALDKVVEQSRNIAAEGELSKLRATVAAQAAQLAEARKIIKDAKNDYQYCLMGDMPPELRGHGYNCINWLAANPEAKP